MRVILIRPHALVSMLVPCLLTIVCSALVAGTEDLETGGFLHEAVGMKLSSIELEGFRGRQDVSRD